MLPQEKIHKEQSAKTLNFFGIGFKINRKSGYELSAIHSTYFMSEEKGVKLSYFTTSGLSTY